MNLKPETIEKIDKLVPRYPTVKSAALPLCHLVQEDQGYLSNEAMEWIANRLDLQPINILELVTFYPMLRTEPTGKHHVRVCRTLPCALAGAYQTCKKLEEAFNCKVGHTSEDGSVTLEFVECHADCGKAPVVMVGEDEYTNISPDKASEFAEKIKNGEI
ncbi:MAG: NAD(P)H-dependent oxidoreductase subunit E [Opitutales bacterium]|jgi:NADH-quinone oxidoreductase subunit E|nr:NAD(P)H-dependent oxidoreductase subunit E [Opitutales bacterium]MDP4643486.1 NAD(P)H-dependent oxidoreductase subunit E [Opitutales bacterium]MDP4694604.1 NAD(P)H-dependent oxidoreductase subunit E [Opitutales bacterium]MDP4778151.1 NAD(P)H-dependent oxidoreductase subunit E [Opitutales bacterium]MDP4883238.1 NAD(P)H-dependent oxidoreductase subunit E [Opitutales bacterium]